MSSTSPYCFTFFQVNHISSNYYYFFHILAQDHNMNGPHIYFSHLLTTFLTIYVLHSFPFCYFCHINPRLCTSCDLLIQYLRCPTFHYVHICLQHPTQLILFICTPFYFLLSSFSHLSLVFSFICFLYVNFMQLKHHMIFYMISDTIYLSYF